MRTDLDHLPERKREDLKHVVRILFGEFEEAISRATQPWKKRGRILKLILYGSYARGDWVDDPVGGYTSDYDILVVVNDERLTDVVDYWSVADDRLMRETTITGGLTAPVSFIIHALADVNQQLEKGRPFFADIVQQGIVLYEAEGFPFSTPRKLPEEEARDEAQRSFAYWFPLSEHALALARTSIENGVQRDAAFMLHQAAERAYHCALLVLTLYSPKSHKLNFLRSQAEQIAPELIEAWPRERKLERRCFELLRLAYVNARYSPEYRVKAEELEWLCKRVFQLQRLVRIICDRRLR